MPLYEFRCKKCDCKYTELSNYDSSGKYSKIKCPKCKSKKKINLVSLFTPVGTSNKHDNFGYRAGFYYERAQAERRFADEYRASRGLDANAYEGTLRDQSDFEKYGEGIHDNEESIIL